MEQKRDCFYGAYCTVMYTAVAHPYKKQGTQGSYLVPRPLAVAQGWYPSILTKPDYKLPHNKVSLPFIS